MKHLLTLAALLVSTLSLAQFTPYNPDADNDQFVGAQDLLAFLPLFGEDWDLDSLNIYYTNELEPPSWCDYPGNNACTQYRMVPQDADIVVHGDGPEKSLVLPDMPKPMIVFGTPYEPNIYVLTFDSPQGEIEVRSVQSKADSYAIVLLSFGGQWYLQR